MKFKCRGSRKNNDNTFLDSDTIHDIIKFIENQDNQSEEALKHSRSYSSLLSIYVKSTRTSIIIKNILKCLFFFITMGTLVAVVFFFYFVLRYVFVSFDKIENINNISIEMILSMVTIILPAISSLIVAFVKIPEIIAKYLFNIQEDDNMNKIIKNIQDYDKDMFAMEHKVEEALMSNKKENEELKDVDILESPRENVK